MGYPSGLFQSLYCNLHTVPLRLPCGLSLPLLPQQLLPRPLITIPQPHCFLLSSRAPPQGLCPSSTLCPEGSSLCCMLISFSSFWSQLNYHLLKEVSVSLVGMLLQCLFLVQNYNLCPHSQTSMTVSTFKLNRIVYFKKKSETRVIHTLKEFSN